MIVVEHRGLAERIALMDRYRLHDEDRRRMMVRPRVWVEELPDDEEAKADAAPAEEDDDARAAPPAQPPPR
jgi:hypothetical protein